MRRNRHDRIRPSEITDQETWLKRRQLIKAGVAAGAGLLLGSASGLASAIHTGLGKNQKISSLKETPYGKELELTAYKHVTTYNNFYELGYGKQEPAENAQALKTRPWSIEVSGECAKPGVMNIEDVLKLDQEERIYRFRCVEAWSMVIPWVGVSLATLLKRFEPTSKAKFVEFETLYDPERMPGQKRKVLDWPYREGLRIDEAMHPLAFMATGLYGEVLPGQNGAPLRLVVPWKYGFKNIKSIVSIRFIEQQPINTWNVAAPNEYGFYANVNPRVAHPRWSQKRHRVLGKGIFGSKEDTLLFNGYADEVASLYSGMDLRKNF
ncbi:MAG TPA: protein-methionine-sulfoxide reductase catalytic subunit MsrP [Thiolapillus brandeum]|uniref:Protein-methionine-sulfoxide reductase catalytic subunit MsrP n=1 Tax=Thiolapillus brandeum TaxID=1076588 RepID=A0A831K348_9GAMM|nr:protein-methionine-sulfoxide reductase catalytic subunit MsrP [Thiolapillus brandeum]